MIKNISHLRILEYLFLRLHYNTVKCVSLWWGVETIVCYCLICLVANFNMLQQNY